MLPCLYKSSIKDDRRQRQFLLGIWTPFWPEGVGIWMMQSSKVQMPGVCPFTFPLTVVTIFFRSMYNKTIIIRFGFGDIQNNQGLGFCW